PPRRLAAPAHPQGRAARARRTARHTSRLRARPSRVPARAPVLRSFLDRGADGLQAQSRSDRAQEAAENPQAIILEEAMTTMTEHPVKKSVTIKASVDHAFRVFTEGFDSWWPRSHHIGKSPMTRGVIEGRTNGRCYSEQE